MPSCIRCAAIREESRAVVIGFKNWRTPSAPGSIFDKLNKEFGFTLDAAASHANHLVDRYCTEEGKFFYDQKPVKVDDNHGLVAEAWEDEIVFWNPPYDDILPWVQIANLNVAKVSVGLLPPSIDTAWYDECWPDDADGKDKTVCVTRKTDDYHAIVWMKATREALVPVREIRQMKGRIRFLRPATNIVRPIVRFADGVPYQDSETVPNEDDPNSVVGESPRAGNIVVVNYRV